MTLRLNRIDAKLQQSDFISRLIRFSSQLAFLSTRDWLTSTKETAHLKIEVSIGGYVDFIMQKAVIVLDRNPQDCVRGNRLNAGFCHLSLEFRYTFRF